MRILLPVHQGGSRGIGRILRGLCASLPAALSPGDELIVVGRELQDSEQRRLQSSRPTEASPRLRRLLFEQLYVPVAARGSDLVHLCDLRPLLLSRRPFLLTVHDVFFLDHPEWFPARSVRYRKAMLAAAVRKRPGVIICVSHYTRDRLLEHYPQAANSRIVVIHSGVEPIERSGDDDRRAGEQPYFLTVSTIEPRKNHLGLLEAFKIARKAGLEVKWKVAGAVGECAEDAVAALRAEPGVEVLGHVSDDTLERLYRSALFVATPSHAEGFGFPPLEAMARGIPTICSTGSAFDETVGDAALRVPAGDHGLWAEALQTLTSDTDERSRLRELGLQRVRLFNLDRAARTYVDAYREALESPPQ